MGIDAAIGTGQTAAVNDTGVVQRIADDEIALTHQGRNNAQIGGKTGLEDQASLGLLEFGQRPFQFLMDLLGAGAGADRAGSRPRSSRWPL